METFETKMFAANGRMNFVWSHKKVDSGIKPCTSFPIRAQSDEAPEPESIRILSDKATEETKEYSHAKTRLIERANPNGTRLTFVFD